MRHRLSRWVALFPAALYLGLAAFTFRDYGLTFDEQNLAIYGQRVARWYATWGHDFSALQWGDHHLYGALFELVAHAARRLTPVFGLYEGRHLLNTLFGGIAIAAAGGIGQVLAGRLGGLLAGLFLLTHPVFYGHGFNNPKDVPFAALYAVALLAAIRTARRPDLGGWRGAVITGAAVGLALGMRIAGLVLLPAIVALWMAVPSRPPLRRLVARVAILTLVAWAVMTALWPYAQVDPLRNPFRALAAFQSFHHEYVNLFEGVQVPSDQLPRRYLPEWLALTWPDVYFIALPLGIALSTLALAASGPRRRRERARLALWVAAASIAPVVWVVLTHPPLYDGMRHFLFALPGLAAVAGAGAARAVRAPAKRRWRAAIALLLLLPTVQTVRDMVELHPYQSVYFNRWAAGGLPHAATRFDTDYWGNSYREGIEWLAAQYPGPYNQPLRVSNTSTCFLTGYFLEKEALQGRFVADCEDGARPHFILSTTREQNHQTIPGELVHTVRRQGVALCYVFETRKPRPAEPTP